MCFDSVDDLVRSLIDAWTKKEACDVVGVELTRAQRRRSRLLQNISSWVGSSGICVILVMWARA